MKSDLILAKLLFFFDTLPVVLACDKWPFSRSWNASLPASTAKLAWLSRGPLTSGGSTRLTATSVPLKKKARVRAPREILSDVYLHSARRTNPKVPRPTTIGGLENLSSFFSTLHDCSSMRLDAIYPRRIVIPVMRSDMPTIS